MTHEELRERHYRNLNSYRDTIEYQATAHELQRMVLLRAASREVQQRSAV